mmetsp:Transcript_69424/g.194149  ORF Transcript_69424/g.194149 Transcript_69424/m.194149 type:complete len:367 (-) Transcript_69424:117-1217(-)
MLLISTSWRCFANSPLSWPDFTHSHCRKPRSMERWLMRRWIAPRICFCLFALASSCSSMSHTAYHWCRAATIFFCLSRTNHCVRMRSSSCAFCSSKSDALTKPFHWFIDRKTFFNRNRAVMWRMCRSLSCSLSCSLKMALAASIHLRRAALANRSARRAMNTFTFRNLVFSFSWVSFNRYECFAHFLMARCKLRCASLATVELTILILWFCWAITSPFCSCHTRHDLNPRANLCWVMRTVMYLIVFFRCSIAAAWWSCFKLHRYHCFKASLIQVVSRRTNVAFMIRRSYCCADFMDTAEAMLRSHRRHALVCTLWTHFITKRFATYSRCFKASSSFCCSISWSICCNWAASVDLPMSCSPASPALR